MANSNEVKLTELHEVCAAANHEALSDMMIAGKHDNNIDYKDPDWDERAPLHWCAIRGKIMLHSHTISAQLIRTEFSGLFGIRIEYISII